MITPGELQLLKLLAQGKSNKEIAKELGIAEQTIKNRFHFLFLKLGVSNRTAAVVKAIKEGLVEII